MDRRLDAHSERLRVAEIGLGKLQVQVALAAGVGSLLGGGIVAMVVQFIGK